MHLTIKYDTHVIMSTYYSEQRNYHNASNTNTIRPDFARRFYDMLRRSDQTAHVIQFLLVVIFQFNTKYKLACIYFTGTMS